MGSHVRALLYVVVVFALSLTSVMALAQDVTPTPAEHDAHHPATSETPAPPPVSAESGMSMMSMMDTMMGMEMSPEMMPMMQQMHGMMDMMMSGMGMEAMSDLLNDMTGMEMSPEMMPMMQQMRGMMDVMMSGTKPDTNAGMGMDTGYSSNDLAPLAKAYYQGEMVYFIHPEASDPGVAEVLTAMMGAKVLTVPSLADIPADLLNTAYVFTNGIEGMGPLGFQPDVFDSVPADEGYTPLRAIQLVTWQEDTTPREISSVEDILAAEAGGEVVIERPGVVVNMPILVWGNQQR